MTKTKQILDVAIIDCGLDLQKLYNSDRHSYKAHWIDITDLSYRKIEKCDLLIVPVGSDGRALAEASDCLKQFLLSGGWVLTLDGLVDGIFEEVSWRHTTTDYKNQSFRSPKSKYQSLVNGVDLEGLVTKDGVKGWWCEGELIGECITPLLVDQQQRIVAGVVGYGDAGGRLIATAAGRLPLFSADPLLAPNVFFRNLLDERLRTIGTSPAAATKHHIYLNSGNYAQLAFLRSEEFNANFLGIHWRHFDEATVNAAKSIWIPWESNVRAMPKLVPLLERAVKQGATLVIEDLRNNWLPGINWYPRPVDSSWWREGRKLDLHATSELSNVFKGIDKSVFSWHYHGVFDGAEAGTPLLIDSEGKCVLSLCQKAGCDGRTLISTLDATFEFGVGKIKETRDYISTVLAFIESSNAEQTDKQTGAN